MSPHAGPPPPPPCTSLQQVIAEAVRPQPWRNGGGATRVLCSGPASDPTGGPTSGPTSDDWLWRVSLADITQDGPFSAFPGVRRWFTVVQGAGVRLGLAAGTVALTPASPPVAFDGADAPACTLLGGATRDLNLMVRAAGAQACLLAAPPGEAWTGLDGPAAPNGQAGWRAVFSAEPAWLQCGDAPPLALPAMGLSLQAEAEAGATAWRWWPDPAHATTTPRAWWLALRLATDPVRA